MSENTRTLRPLAAAVTALGAGAVLALGPALSATADAGAEATSTGVGSTTVITFVIPHGCDGSATTGFTIDLPESVTSVVPTTAAGWTIEKVARDSREVGQLVYTAETPLADGYRATFDVQLQLPDEAVGDVLEFPTAQSCEVGSVDWVGETAPKLELTAATSHDEAPAAEEPTTAAPATGDDVLARGLAVGGLAVGAIGVVLAVLARRSTRA